MMDEGNQTIKHFLKFSGKTKFVKILNKLAKSKLAKA
jgi:hypothetical protein